MNQLITQTQEKQIQVYLKPCNEKQELNYQESFTGTTEQIVERSLEIIGGLQSILTNGSFSVKVQNQNLSRAVYIDSEHIFDDEFNVVQIIENSVDLNRSREENILVERAYMVSFMRFWADNFDIRDKDIYIPDDCEKYGFVEGKYKIGKMVRFLADMLEE